MHSLTYPCTWPIYLSLDKSPSYNVYRQQRKPQGDRRLTTYVGLVIFNSVMHLARKEKHSTNQYTLSRELCIRCHRHTRNCQVCSYTSSDPYTRRYLSHTRLCLHNTASYWHIHGKCMFFLHFGKKPQYYERDRDVKMMPLIPANLITFTSLKITYSE